MADSSSLRTGEGSSIQPFLSMRLLRALLNPSISLVRTSWQAGLTLIFRRTEISTMSRVRNLGIKMEEKDVDLVQKSEND
ncbi:hypothetical protein U1Q18_009131 [Sarracenia purpurea var. burkii]